MHIDTIYHNPNIMLLRNRASLSWMILFELWNIYDYKISKSSVYHIVGCQIFYYTHNNIQDKINILGRQMFVILASTM